MDPERIEELRTELEEFDRTILERGRDYFVRRRVTDISVGKRKISGLVRGSQRYETEWTYRGGFWTGLCSCPIGVNCKHAAALAYAVITMDAIVEVTGKVSPQRKPPENPLLGEVQGRIGRKLLAAERNLLEAISEIHRRIVAGRQQFLNSYEATRLGLPRSVQAPIWGERREMEGWWNEPPEDVADFIEYIVLYLKLGGHPVSEALAAMASGEKFRADVEALRHAAAVAEWKQRLGKLDLKSAKTPPPLRLRLAGQAVVWEEEVPVGTWRKVSAERVRERASRAYESDEATAILLDLARQGGSYGYRANYALNLSRSEDAEFICRALSRSTARSRVVRADGRPLTFPGEPLCWKLAPDPDSPEEWLLARLALPSGAEIADWTLLQAGSLPLAISSSGEVRPLPRPIEGERCNAARIPRSALLASPRAIHALRETRAILPEELAESIVPIALAPCLVCELRADRSRGSEEVRCLALAVSRDPDIEMMWKGTQGWEPRRENAATSAAPTGPTQVPDPSPADDLVARLCSLSSKISHAGDWIIPVGRKFAEEFARWARSLPPGIEIRASPELRAFFEPTAPSVSLDFQIEERSTASDWFDVRASLRHSDLELTPEEMLALLKARGNFVRLKSGAWTRMEARFDDEDLAALNAVGLTLDSVIAGEKHGFHALQLAGEHGARLAGAEAHSRIARRAAELRAIEPPPQPKDLGRALRPYQMEGFHFLAFLSENRLGGILADDMGLGKTIQTLAWLLWLRARGGTGGPFRALVVCPKSVVHNWCVEAAKFAPSIRCEPFSTSAEEGIVVANYTQLRLQADWFSGRTWDAVILDEGQNIKNPASQTAKIARELPSAHRAVLTGTPIENRPLDLWSLFAFAQPGLLGSQASFKRLFESDGRAGDALARLHARVRHFLLRRTKAQVAPELPPRTEEEIVCDLAGEQADLYQAELKEARRLVLGLENQADFDKARFHVLQRLLRLRQICCDPRLLAGGTGPAVPSAKMEALLEQLRPMVDEGHKILVFSQFVEMLGHMSDALDREGIAHLMLTGQTEDRQQMVEKFQSDPEIPVFLLSLKAAGAGLNLTAASYVILYDPWWNPAVEAQAIDRTHRIGQQKPVIAYRLLTGGTIEQKIRSLQKQKAAIADAVVREESLASVLDIESIRFLLAES